ncbi:MAG: arginase family protein [Chloroflexota bacterium]|jgi:arginase
MALRVLGVPSAAGAYGHGVARAPAALRGAGLVGSLRGRGLTVADAGDLPLVPFAPDPASPRAQHLEQVVAVAREVADRVAAIDQAGDVPLVLGGNCTITLGVIAGLCARHPRLGLAYLDGDADMSTPERTLSGILDAMGIAAMLGLAGAPPALTSLGPREPLMVGRDVAIIGYDATELDAEPSELLLQHGVHLFDGAAVRGRASAAAADVLEALAHRDGLVVHFDVDVIDSTDLPLAQFPHFNQGLSLADGFDALGALVSAPDLLAAVITEVNPDNDPDGRHVRRLVEGLTEALGRSTVGSRAGG